MERADLASHVVEQPQPPISRWVLGFLLVGAAWGMTTPFMRRAAVHYTPPLHPYLSDPDAPSGSRKIWGIIFAVMDLLRRPGYAVPLLINVTGSIWFFLLLGSAELSLMVPITNSCAFLFTVLGEWLAEHRVIEAETWFGMALVLGGILLCVVAKQ